MRSILSTGLLAAAALLAACSDSTDPVGNLQFSVSPATAWAGAEVSVRSTASFESFPSFSLDGAELTTRRVDDVTWAVTLPSTASGSVALSVRVGGDSATIEPVTVRGFTGTHLFATGIQDNLLVWQKDGDATALGSDGLNLLEINATTNSLTIYDSLLDQSHGLKGAGPTTLDGAFVIWPADSATAQTWSLAPTPQKVTSIPTRGYAEAAMGFGNGGYLNGFGNMFTVGGTSNDYAELGVSEVEGGVMSPTHDRATIRVDWEHNGVPVFDAATGAIAYRVAGLQSSEGVAFSGDGQLLAVAGSDSCVGCADARVALIRASDGEIVHDTTFAGEAWGIAFDRSRPLLYVGVSVLDSTESTMFRPGVLVLDRVTFAKLGLLTPPTTEPACGRFPQQGCYGAVLVTSDEPAVYALSGFFTPKLQSWRFGTGD